jgi:amino acid transporter
MAEPISTPEKTALWSVLFGLCVAVASLALPLAFDLPSFLWRVSFCAGVIGATISAFFIGYDNFAKSHPNAKSKKNRVAAFLIVGIAIVVGAVWISIVLPRPHPAINQEDLKEALFQPPHVVITQAQPTFLSKDDGIRFIVYFINVGPRAIRNVTIHFGLGFTLGGTISREEQEKEFVRLSGLPMDKNGDDFMDAGVTRNSTFPGDLGYKTPITLEKLKEIQKKNEQCSSQFR